jgi:hypothetical protein
MRHKEIEETIATILDPDDQKWLNEALQLAKKERVLFFDWKSFIQWACEQNLPPTKEKDK